MHSSMRKHMCPHIVLYMCPHTVHTCRNATKCALRIDNSYKAREALLYVSSYATYVCYMCVLICYIRVVMHMCELVRACSHTTTCLIYVLILIYTLYICPRTAIYIYIHSDKAVYVFSYYYISNIYMRV